MTESTKIALVTGASRGIGRAIAEELARDHYVIAGATTEDGVKGLGDAPFIADLTDPVSIVREVEKLDLDSLDVLVHSAGILQNPRIEDTTWDMWEESFRLNVFAPAELTRLLLPALRKAKGTVVAINSGSGYHSGETNSIYSGTKFALRAFTDALRAEEVGNIRVTSVHPGRVDTDMQRALRASEGITDYDGERWVHPRNIARAVRLAVDTSMESSVDEISVRPSGV